MMCLFDRVGAEGLISTFCMLVSTLLVGGEDFYNQVGKHKKKEVLSLVESAILVKFHFLLAGKMRTGEEETVQVEV